MPPLTSPGSMAAPATTKPGGKGRILFLDQQSWRSGAQKVLETVLDAVRPDCEPWVAFPDRGDFSRKLEEKGIGTLTYPLGSYRSGQKSWAEGMGFAARSLVCGLKLARHILQSNTRLVYVNGPRCLPAGVLAARLTGRPLLFHLHLTLCRKPEVRLVAFLSRYVTATIACSHAAAEPILRARPSLSRQTHVLYNPVPRHTPAAAVALVEPRPSDCLTLGMIGRITERKGHMQLLNALSRLSPGLQRQVQLLIVGAPAPGNSADMAYARRLRDCAAKLHLHQVTWAGYQADPNPFYASLDALLQPSLHQAGEGMPLAVLETFHFGVPVIAARTGGIPEIVREGVNGLLVPAGDEVALAQALQQFLSNPPLRDRLRAGARSTLTDQFSVEGFQCRIRSLIRELAGPQIPGKAPLTQGEAAA